MREMWNYPFPASPIVDKSTFKSRVPFRAPFASPSPPKSPSPRARSMPYTPPRATVRSPERSVSRRGQIARVSVKRHVWAPEICSIWQEDANAPEALVEETNSQGHLHSKQRWDRQKQRIKTSRTSLNGRQEDKLRRQMEPRIQTKVQVNNEGNFKTFTFGPTSDAGPYGTRLFCWKTVNG